MPPVSSNKDAKPGRATPKRVASLTEQKDRPQRRSRSRELNEQKILTAAEYVFARFGYNGASVEAIAERAGLSKQNMLYYFPSKEQLYLSVLEHILNLWLEKMALLEQKGKTPAAMLENYIRGKIELSRLHPDGSKVFANEIINGAPHLRGYLQEHLIPQLQEDVALVNSWIAAGEMDALSAEHLFFMIWAATQTYADFAIQIQLALGKEELDDAVFQQAGDFLTQLILKGTGLSKA